MAFDKNVPLAANQITADLTAINANWEFLLNNSYCYAADAEASDTYVITLAPAITAYTTGMVIHFKANTANTGACTLNVNALGAKAIKKHHDQDPADGDIEAGQIVTVVYDGTNFQMQSQPGVAPARAGANSDITSMTGLDDDGIPAAKVAGGIEGAILGDGTAGLVVRKSSLLLQDGTNASTLKCTLTDEWNGDGIAVVDNVAKGATTGTYWTLDATGKILTIEASGLTGNAVGIIASVVRRNSTGGRAYIKGSVDSNDLVINAYTTGTSTVDLTALVDSGVLEIDILYITDA